MAATIPFIRKFDADYGRADQVSPLIRRVIARNPGAFTFTGTGTYIIGRGELAVIDPGPMIDAHLDALLAATNGERITHILLTHTHLDHSPLAAPLKLKSGATTYAYGPHGAGKLETGVPVEEGGDMEFRPDVTVRDGDVIRGKGWTFDCVFTPGHTSNHMCFALREEKALFTGDHVMGWSTSVIAPPDGDMRAYMASLEKLLARDDQIYWPTHGAPVTEPQPFVEAFISHRLEREAQIMAAISSGRSQISEMVALIYAAVDKRLHPAAALSVFAHLEKLIADGRVVSDGPPSLKSTYAAI